MKTSLFRARPHLWYQLYWVVYLIWFFWLDLTVTDPKYIIHSPLDDFIPFNEWFIFPYGSWFFLLAGVTALLWWFDTASYDKLCLMMFSGMTFCLILYMVLPNGLDIRPTVEEVGRSNIAMTLMQLIWKADASVNVCPSIHCQSSACMAIAFSGSTLAKDRPCSKCWPLAGRRSSARPPSLPSSTPSSTSSAGWPWHSSGCRCSISVPGSVELFGKIYSFLLPLLLTAQMPAGTMVVADISHFRALPVSEGA